MTDSISDSLRAVALSTAMALGTTKGEPGSASFCNADGDFTDVPCDVKESPGIQMV